ncbi:hypothetical protein EKK58_04755 [Candidatus Dependentiae bacterium]|nr:MAG: hypothetical protein EKK58_04755 [Candidatus Dependentiae bacterium]
MQNNTILYITLLLMTSLNINAMLQLMRIEKSLQLCVQHSSKKNVSNSMPNKNPLHSIVCKHYCDVPKKDFNALCKALEKPATPEILSAMLSENEYVVPDVEKLYNHSSQQIVSCIKDLTVFSRYITWFKIVAAIHIANIPIYQLSGSIENVQYIEPLGYIMQASNSFILMTTGLVLCYQLPFVPFWFFAKKITENQLPLVLQNHKLLRTVILDLEKKEAEKAKFQVANHRQANINE